MLYIGLLLGVVAIWFLRVWLVQRIEKATIILNPELTHKIKGAQENGIVRGSFLQGPNKIYYHHLKLEKTKPSVFIVHGNGESISDWLDTQLMLKKLGYSSYVFDYTGFGSSEGKASVKNLRCSTEIAWDLFCESNPNQDKIIVAHSLGVAVLLEALPKFKHAPSKLILHGAFSSAREIATYMGEVPYYLSFLVPNVWNNLKNIRTIKDLKIHLFHSKNDLKIPYFMSEQIAFHNANVNLVFFEHYGHNAIYENIEEKFWKTLLEEQI